MGTTMLLEREALLREMSGLASDSWRGRGRLLLVAGEAGVGKTSLVREFLSRQQPGVAMLAGACDAMAAPRPLGPVLDFAQQIGDEFARLAETGEQRNRLFSLLLEKLRSGRHLLVFEDLHWADDASLDLLLYLGRRLHDCPTLLMGTYRDDETGPDHPLRRTLGHLAGAGTIERIQVARLSPEAVRELAAGSDTDPDELHRRTGGNAFFVTEVLAAGGQGVPASVGDAVLARAARLSPAGRRVLELAGVIGQTVAPELLRRLEQAPEAIDECIESGLLESRDGRLAFRHELARDALVGSMAAGRRRLAHAAVLAALTPAPEAPDAALEELAILAHHAGEADDGPAVLRFAPAAGRLAMKLAAHREAHVQFERAISFAALLEPVARADLFGEFAAVCGVTSRLSEAVAANRQAVALAAEAGDIERQARFLSRLATQLVALGRNEESEQAAADAVRLIQELPERAERATVYGMYAHIRMLHRDTDESLRWARRAISCGRRTGNLRAVAGAHNSACGAALTAERIDIGMRHKEASLRAAAQAGIEASHVVANLYTNVGSGLGEIYRFREADEALASGIAAARQFDLDDLLIYATSWQALSHLHQGRWQEAGTAATWVLERPHDSAISRIMALVALGRLRIRRGDPDAWQALDEALELAQGTRTLQRLAPVRAARAEAALARGDPELAGEEARAALELALRHNHKWFIGHLAYLVFRAGGDPKLPDTVTGPFALQVRGKPGLAARSWQRLGCPFEQATALAECDRLPQLRSALEIFNGLGARPAALRTAERLRQLGVRGIPRGPQAATRANPVGLTPRESQVLGLLAQGLRNSEIAARNRVSKRTVDHQVSAVLGKLGVRSRTEAVAEGQRLDLLGNPDNFS